MWVLLLIGIKLLDVGFSFISHREHLDVGVAADWNQTARCRFLISFSQGTAGYGYITSDQERTAGCGHVSAVLEETADV